ncbi:MAG: hypothetical protein HC817_07780 [Saprospiraceae bacterium]|nr:hypothetical protein [Saprospiraceae bacterium]
MIVYLLTVFFFFSFPTLEAQIEGNSGINPALLQSEMAKRGLTEAEVRAKLLSKGINMDEIRPEQLPSLRGRIEEAIAELEREKREKEAKIKQAQEVQVRDSVVRAAEVEQDRAEDLVKKEARQASKKKADDIREEIKKRFNC